MNRYAAHGIHHDALTGRRVLVITRTQTDARDALEQIAMHAEPHGAHIRRANGLERITYDGAGRVIIRSRRGHGHRGITADTIYLDEGVDPELTIDQAASLMACLATSPTGELIRA